MCPSRWGRCRLRQIAAGVMADIRRIVARVSESADLTFGVHLGFAFGLSRTWRSEADWMPLSSSGGQARNTRRTAEVERSTSRSLVCQLQTEMRMQRLP